MRAGDGNGSIDGNSGLDTVRLPDLSLEDCANWTISDSSNSAATPLADMMNGFSVELDAETSYTLTSSEGEEITLTGIESMELTTENADDAVSAGYISISDAISDGIMNVKDAISDGFISAADAINGEFIAATSALDLGFISAADAINGELISAGDAINSELITVEDALGGDLITLEDAVMETSFLPSMWSMPVTLLQMTRSPMVC